MKTVAGYGRVSTQEQVEKGTSAEAQKRKIRRECKKQGYKLYRFFADDGFSGKSVENRPGLQALIADAKEGKFDLLMFTKLDRLGRNLRELLNVWSLLQEDLGLDLVCIDDPTVNTKGRLGKVIVAILGCFAEFERDTIKERTDAGRKIRWKKGEARIGQPTYGYRWDDEKKTYEIIPRQAKVYARICSMFLDQNFSARDIANRLSRDGVQSPSEAKGHSNKAKRWNNMTIRNMLRNGAYKGQVQHNRYYYEEGVSKVSGRQYMAAGKQEKPEAEWIKVKFPPLIAESRWNDIQKKIEFNKTKPKKIHKGYEDHFLAENVVYCGECGGRMHKQLKVERNRKERFYYLCYWHGTSKKELETNARERCVLKSVNAEKIDQKIFHNVVKLITKPGPFAREWLKDLNLEEVKQKCQMLRKKEEEYEQKIKLAYESATADPVLRKLWQKNTERDVGEYKAIQSQLKKAEREYDLLQNKVDRFEQFERAWKRVRGNLRKEASVIFKTKKDFADFLYSLPFAEKKRVLEAVIAPEVEGRCEVRYLTPSDLIDSSGPTAAIDKKNQGKPLTEREPVVEMRFEADLNRIEQVINSLNRRELLNKFEIDTISKRGTDAYRRRWISPWQL